MANITEFLDQVKDVADSLADGKVSYIKMFDQENFDLVTNDPVKNRELLESMVVVLLETIESKMGPDQEFFLKDYPMQGIQGSGWEDEFVFWDDVDSIIRVSARKKDKYEVRVSLAYDASI